MPFLVPTAYRLLAVFLCVAFLFSAGFRIGWKEKGLRDDHQRQVEQIQADALLQAATATANEKAQQGLALNYQIEVLHDQHQDEINEALAANRQLVATLRLRGPGKAAGRGGAMPANPGSSGSDSAGSGDDGFSGELARLSVEMAAGADRNTEQLKLCQQFIKRQYEAMQ